METGRVAQTTWKEIKNKELWQELYEQTQKHRVTLEFSESTRYSDRLQSKMR